MRDFLAEMAGSSARRAAAARRHVPEAALRRRALAAPSPPPLRLDPSGFDLIAEIKLRSPSAGRLAPAGASAGIAARAAAYARGGAAAISVLTEPDAFDGALAHLERAAAGLAVPVLRKDFLVDPYQVLEARAAGAGGVLLILRIVNDARLAQLLEAVAEMGLFVLLEAFDEQDVARAAAIRSAGPPANVLVGVNARDLGDLSCDPERQARLVKGIPPGRPCVAESGIGGAEDVRRIVRLGYGLALVGEALMRAPDPQDFTGRLVAAGRIEARTSCASV